MRGNKLFVVTVALGAAMLVFAACGGGGGGGNKASSKDQQEFQSLSDKAKTSAFKVTYQDQDEHGNPSGDPWTLSQTSETKRAYIQGNSKIVIDGDKAWNCDDLDTTPSCTEVPGGADGAAGLVAGYASLFTNYTQALATGVGDAGFTDKSTQTIAGQQATCWKWSIGGAAGGIAKSILNATGIGKVGWETCVDSDTGVALSLKYTGPGSNGDVGIIATKYEQPADADFATPTTVGDNGSTPDTSGDTTTSVGSTDTSTPDTSGGSTPTSTCITLPNGNTVPPGVNIPGVCNP